MRRWAKTLETYKVIVSTPNAEEKVRVSRRVRGGELAVRQHNLNANDVVDGETNLVAEVVQAFEQFNRYSF